MPEVKASTQDHLDIYDIDENMVILKNGGARIILQTTAVNFDLLSEREQDAIISAYSGLLNSISFTVQILVRSKHMDISFYIDRLRQLEKDQGNRQLKERITSYRNYVEQLVSKNEVLDKRFYIIIPYDEVLLTSPQNPLKKLLFGQKKLILDKSRIIKKAKIQLEPKREHIIKQLNRVGIRARQLSTAELVSLFYDIYNPDISRQQHLRLGTADYTAPIVKPAVIR
jgi:hypothetical protein